MTDPSRPRITAFRNFDSAQEPHGPQILAVMTIEHWPWTLAGWQLCRGEDGGPYLRGPMMKRPHSRLFIRPSPERDALLAEALRRYRELSDS